MAGASGLLVIERILRDRRGIWQQVVEDRDLSRLTGRSSNGSKENGRGDAEQTSVLSDPGRHHRRPAELAVRLAPYPAVSPGHPLAISVRMDALHFFDERGDRIDVGWR